MNTFWDDIKAILGRPTVKLIILVIVSLIICGVYASEKEDGPIHVIQNATKTVITPIQELSISAKSGLSKLTDKIYDNYGDAETISELKEENSKLKSQIVADEKYKQEANKYREMLKLKDQYNVDGIAAHVIGFSGNAWNQTVTIGVGSKDGVCAGQTVMGTTGIVGQIDSVNLFTSSVRLLTDPNSGVAVKVLNNNNDCILRGSLDGVLYLEGLGTNDLVSVGDVVTSSGLGGSYVPNLLVGNVLQLISLDSGVNRKIVVSPVEKLSTITEVFIIMESL